MAAQSKFINGHTLLVSLLGNPIRHSKSPVTHSVSFELMGIDAVYLAFNVNPEDLPQVTDAFRRMDGWVGSNVTMPCKQAIIPCLDGLSPAAELMGAVNVVEKTADNKLIGHNSDGAGFWQNMSKQGVEVEGKTVTVIGPGGAGSAIWVEAALRGAKKINIFARQDGPSYNHTKDLMPGVIERTGCDVQLLAFEDKDAMKAAVAESDILANASSVGMGYDCTDTPVPAEFIKEGMVVGDAVYLPLETQLLKDAAAKGCQCVGGIGMMNEQAAIGEKIWFDIDMPMDAITAELNS